MKLKTPLGPFFYITPVEDGMGGRAGFNWVSMERATFLNIQNTSVLCRVSKGDQSHFEALEASFVCEGCEVLPKWLRQFFKTHLQLTLGASAFIVFWGAQVLRHMIEFVPFRKGFLRIKIWALGSLICYSTESPILLQKWNNEKHWTKSRRDSAEDTIIMNFFGVE